MHERRCRRRRRCAVAIMSLALLPGTLSAESLLQAFGCEIREPFRDAVSRQYDFWIGHWGTNWRQPVEGELDPADSSSWTEQWVFPVLGGKALVEVARGREPRPQGWITQGFSIRYWDAAKERWVMAQNWPAPDTSSGFADQLQGFERHGRIQVYSAYHTQDGSEEIRRYTFSDIQPERFRWDSTTTRDRGKTWTTGSVAESSRLAEPLRLPAVGSPLPDWVDGTHCKEPAFHRFDGLEGEWTGIATLADRSEAPGRLVAARFQNGCSVLAVASWGEDEERHQVLQAITYGTQSEAWFALHLDDRFGTPHQYRVGAEEDGDMLFLENRDLLIASETEPLGVPEEMRSASATARTRWTGLGSDALVLSFEERKDDGWRSVLSMELRRNR